MTTIDTPDGSRRPGDDQRVTIEVVSEFAAVSVSIDSTGRGPRLRVEDLETGDVVLLDALELASFCHATDDQRQQWLRTGHYRIDSE